MAETKKAKAVTLTNTDGSVAYYAMSKTNMVTDNNGKDLDTIHADMTAQISRKMDATDITAAQKLAMNSGITSTKVTGLDALLALGITFDKNTNVLGIGGKKFNLVTGGSADSGDDDSNPIVEYGTPVVNNFKYGVSTLSNEGTGTRGLVPTLSVTQTVTRRNGDKSLISYATLSEAMNGGVSFLFSINQIGYGSVSTPDGLLTLPENTSATDKKVTVSVIAAANGVTSAKASFVITVQKTTPTPSALLRKEVTYINNDNGKYGYKLKTISRASDGTIETSEDKVTITDRNDIYTGMYDTCMDLNGQGKPEIYNKNDGDTPNDGAPGSVVLTGFIPCEGAQYIKVDHGVGGPQLFFFTTNNADLSGYIAGSAIIQSEDWEWNSGDIAVPSGAKFVRMNVSKGSSTIPPYLGTIKYND